jgi:hypothetical protein
VGILHCESVLFYRVRQADRDSVVPRVTELTPGDPCLCLRVVCVLQEALFVAAMKICKINAFATRSNSVLNLLLFFKWSTRCTSYIYFVTAIASLKLQLPHPVVPTPCIAETFDSSRVTSNCYARCNGAVPVFLTTHEPNTVRLPFLGRTFSDSSVPNEKKKSK